jgi:hypothetical protein
VSNDPYRPPEIPVDANLPVADPSGKPPVEQTTGLWAPLLIAAICVMALAFYYTTYVKAPIEQTPVAAVNR